MVERIRRKRLFRFSLRTLLLLMLVFGIWLGWQLDRAKKQKLAVQAIKDAGGWVKYDFQFRGMPTLGAMSNFNPNASSPVPQVLLDQLGYDFFHDVVNVNLVYNDDGPKRIDNESRTTEWAEHLERLPSLRAVLTQGKQVDDKVLLKIGQLRKLTDFHLWDGSAVTDEGVKHLVKASNLKKVHLSNGGLGDESLKYFATLPNLTTLSLQGNAFTDSGLKHLRDKTELTSLWVGLGDNQITDKGLQHLRGLSNLKQLGVQSVHASPEAGDELQATLPGCRVMFSRRSDLPHNNPLRRN